MELLENLKNYRIFLASKSPRRQDLLKCLDIPFNVISIDNISETYSNETAPEEVPEYLACIKGDAYLSHIGQSGLVITADTLVICNNRIMGKPKDDTEAIKMLMHLSGQTHKVVTGVAISTSRKRISFSVTTEVTFASIMKNEAEYYVRTYNPKDKAGAYGIQEWIGCVAVKEIKGSFYNVMGLPLHRLYEELKKF